MSKNFVEYFMYSVSNTNANWELPENERYVYLTFLYHSQELMLEKNLVASSSRLNIKLEMICHEDSHVSINSSLKRRDNLLNVVLL